MGELNELSVYVFFLNETFELIYEFRMNVFKESFVKVWPLTRIIALNDCRNFQDSFRYSRREAVRMFFDEVD